MRPEVEAGPRLPGTGFQVRCPTFGPDEGQGEVRISPIPPSMVEGRIPAPGLSRGPSRQRAHPIAFSNPHPLSCILDGRVFRCPAPTIRYSVLVPGVSVGEAPKIRTYGVSITREKFGCRVDRDSGSWISND